VLALCCFFFSELGITARSASVCSVFFFSYFSLEKRSAFFPFPLLGVDPNTFCPLAPQVSVDLFYSRTASPSLPGKLAFLPPTQFSSLEIIYISSVLDGACADPFSLFGFPSGDSSTRWSVIPYITLAPFGSWQVLDRARRMFFSYRGWFFFRSVPLPG